MLELSPDVPEGLDFRVAGHLRADVNTLDPSGAYIRLTSDPTPGKHGEPGSFLGAFLSYEETVTLRDFLNAIVTTPARRPPDLYRALVMVTGDSGGTEHCFAPGTVVAVLNDDDYLRDGTVCVADIDNGLIQWVAATDLA